MGAAIRGYLLSQYITFKYVSFQFILTQLMIGSNVVVVLTSMTAVREVSFGWHVFSESDTKMLLSQIVDRRSATTSDRPANYMANLTTDGQHMAISAYNDNWKAQRKAAQAVLSKATNTHLPIQKAEATQLMYDCLKSPQVGSGLLILFPVAEILHHIALAGLFQSYQTTFSLRNIVHRIWKTFSKI